MEQKNRIYRMPVLLIITATVLLTVSCTSRPEEKILFWTGIPAGAQGRKPPRWELNIDSSNRALLRLPYGESAQITGEAFPDENGGWTVYTDELNWFESGYAGWTEARFSLTGSFSLTPLAGGWQLTLMERPEITGVTGGKLRRGDRKVFGDRARDLVARRWTRVVRAAEYGAAAFVESDFPDEKETQENLGGFLFFETPPAEILPEDLIPVIKSGTLAEDYEAGPGLFYLALSWQPLWERIIPRSHIHEERSDK
ncbi:MAG: hypothetical protein JXA95_16215 [Spirochaetales bacterium]|nr:hypothetical protein [Spirochaetales bacterium]